MAAQKAPEAQDASSSAEAKKHEEENRVLEAVQPDPRIGNNLEPNKIGLDKLRVALLRDLCEVWGVEKGLKVDMIERLAHRMQWRAKELRREPRESALRAMCSSNRFII